MAWLNWPNRITITRIVLVFPLVICLLNLNGGWQPMRHLAFALFVVMALSDGIDGYLARKLKEETPLGRFLDPVADKLLTTCAVIILSIDSTAVPGFHLPNWVPVIAIGKDLLTVVGFFLIFAVTGQFFVKPRILGKACTMVQSWMIALVLIAPDLPIFMQRLTPVLWWVASGLAVVAYVDYLRIGNRFAATHHKPKHS